MKLIFVVLCGLLGTAAIASAQTADTVYTNGKIYTVNRAQPWAEALAINNGVLEVVGSNEEALAAAGERTKVIDLGGAFAMPGLIDVHMHGMVSGLDCTQTCCKS